MNTQTIGNGAKLVWDDTQLVLEISKVKRKALSQVGRMIAADARNLCPVGIERKFIKQGQEEWKARVPGTLRKSIRSRVTKKGDKVQVIAGNKRLSKGMNEVQKAKAEAAFYAVMVEFGTSKMSGRPFLRPALHKNESKIEAQFRDQLK